jgi:hypothetical protein
LIVTQDRIVAIGLLTDRNLERLGDELTRLWPIDLVPQFEELLAAIDEADRRLQESAAIPPGFEG